jgi:hypothetical protein
MTLLLSLVLIFIANDDCTIQYTVNCLFKSMYEIVQQIDLKIMIFIEFHIKSHYARIVHTN